MPQYRYQARQASSGQIQAGVLVAENATMAAAILRNQGQHVMQLVPVAAASKVNKSLAKFLNYSSGPSMKDVLDFTTQLAVMIRAGISLRIALEGIAEQVHNVKFRKILLTIKTDVESGKQFSEAITKYPKPDRAAEYEKVPAAGGPSSMAAIADDHHRRHQACETNRPPQVRLLV